MWRRDVERELQMSTGGLWFPVLSDTGPDKHLAVGTWNTSSFNSRDKALSIKSFDAPSTCLLKPNVSTSMESSRATLYLCLFQLVVWNFMLMHQLGGKCVWKMPQPCRNFYDKINVFVVSVSSVSIAFDTDLLFECKAFQFLCIHYLFFKRKYLVYFFLIKSNT